VRADPKSLKSGKRPLTVLPGMMGTAEIAVGKRSVISFVLRPMLKANEAFKER
jgi:adhesin transport system membrane fusion protein